MNHLETPWKRVRQTLLFRGKDRGIQRMDFLNVPFVFSIFFLSTRSAQAYIYFRNKTGAVAQWPTEQALKFKVNTRNKSQDSA